LLGLTPTPPQVGGDYGKSSLHGSVLPLEAFPQPGEGHWLTILPSDSIGLLATINDRPHLVRGTMQRLRANADLNMPDAATVSGRALIGCFEWTGSSV
jgi:hypothetical protein